MKKVYITGISGTGKTAIAYALQDKGIKAINIDEVPDLCFLRNKTNKKKVEHDAILNSDFIKSHEWICDTEYIKNFIRQNETAVVLGIASNQDEFLPLFDVFIILQC